MTAEHTVGIPAELSSQQFRRGYGTYEVALDRLGDEAYTDLLRQAIDLGYRHIDTAQQYQTEPHVADAIQRSEVDSEDMFVATKLHWGNLGYDDAIETAIESKERLGVDTIDLLYVHVPYDTVDYSNSILKMYARNTTGRKTTSRLGESVIGRFRLLIEEIPATTRFRVRRRFLDVRPGRL